MKKIALIAGMIAFLLNVTAQDTTAVNREDIGVLKISDKEFGTSVTLGKDIIVVENDEDVIRIKMGKNGIIVVDPDGVPKIKFDKNDAPDEGFLPQDEEDNDKRRRNRRRFTPHWSGVEFGMNNYLTSDYSTSLPPSLSYMDLNTGRSFNLNINFAQLGIGLTRRFGLVTGVGFEFNNYHFDGNNSITKNDLGEIESYFPDPGIVYDKSKLATSYFVIPLMIEAQIPVNRGNTLNLAAGVIGGAKIGSHTKVVFYDDGKQKVKEKNDFSLNEIRYGPTVRIGYDSFQIYGTYYMNGLFNENKGPELYPVQIGIAFTFD